MARVPAPSEDETTAAILEAAHVHDQAESAPKFRALAKAFRRAAETARDLVLDVSITWPADAWPVALRGLYQAHHHARIAVMKELSEAPTPVVIAVQRVAQVFPFLAENFDLAFAPPRLIWDHAVWFGRLAHSFGVLATATENGNRGNAGVDRLVAWCNRNGRRWRQLATEVVDHGIDLAEPDWLASIHVRDRREERIEAAEQHLKAADTYRSRRHKKRKQRR